MICTNCGRIVNEDEKYCVNCGNNLNDLFTQNNAHHYEQTLSDEDLIDAFIGKNADIIKNKKFSLSTFLFGIYYLLIRKLWLWAGIIFVIAFILNLFLPSYSEYIMYIIYFILAFKFKDIYLNHVKEKVNKIKHKNQGKSRIEIAAICKRKGGTSIIIKTIFIVFILITIILQVSYNWKVRDKVSNPLPQSITK